MPRPLVVWRFTDGKPGHDNQTAGLLAALAERTPVNSFDVPVSACRRGVLAWLTGHDPLGADTPSPDLIIGAGHATHLPMLAARRARGGRIVLHMKPSLPTACFDLCLVPAHDRPRPADNVLVTSGVLNRVRPSTGKDASVGLFLVGGPSAHADWDSDRVAAQVIEIVQRAPDRHWTLATSRRTPAAFVASLAVPLPANLEVVSHEQTTPDWLPGQLARAARVWVTGDSVSMIYEALSSGAATGVLPVQWHKTSNRLAEGVRVLTDEGQVTDFEDWRAGADLQQSDRPFDEAGRCADWIMKKWPIAS